MEKQFNLSITISGKSFWYTFTTEKEVKEIIETIRYNYESNNWVEIKEDIFKISEVQAVIKWRVK